MERERKTSNGPWTKLRFKQTLLRGAPSSNNKIRSRKARIRLIDAMSDHTAGTLGRTVAVHLLQEHCLLQPAPPSVVPDPILVKGFLTATTCPSATPTSISTPLTIVCPIMRPTVLVTIGSPVAVNYPHQGIIRFAIPASP